ncbi:MAG: LD-carboxypeptidase [Oscillospiraceae bacterium]|nr:LD-carboxypeptidase [Oscillospiraceae bacterium]
MVKTIAIVSLSSGTLGEPFIKFELDLGLKRLNEYGVNVKFMPHALSGADYLKAHPEKRAEDLIAAFRDDDADMILCAIGGDDTYRLLPYLFEHDELKQAVTQKIFLGFSDTTTNHFMLNKLGIKTFYGQAFLPDVCELADEMLPYTKHYFEELIATGRISQITPSPVWYETREIFNESELGKTMPSHTDTGFELLQGSPVFEGKILGGCIDTIFDMFDNERYADSAELCGKYRLFPSAEEWQGHILLLETSEEKMSPQKYEKALLELKKRGVFDAVSGVLIGKPMNEWNFDEYRRILVKVIDNPNLPVVCNINVGHAMPRCIIPFGVHAVVNADKQTITF